MPNHNHKKRSAEKKPDDTLMYKALIALCILCAAVFALFRISLIYGSIGWFLSGDPVVRGLMLGFAALSLLALAASLCFKKHQRLFRIIFGAAAVLALSCLILVKYWEYNTALTVLYFLYIGGCVLYLLYLLFPREFFYVSLISTYAGAVFYAYSKQQFVSRSLTLVIAAFFLLVAVIAALTGLSTRRDGRLILFGRQLQMFPPGFRALPIYLVCAIYSVCMIAAMMIGSGFSLFCMYAAIAIEFIAACYYTIKLA